MFKIDGLRYVPSFYLKTVEGIIRANIKSYIWFQLLYILTLLIFYCVFIIVDARLLFLPCTLLTGIFILIILLKIAGAIREYRDFTRNEIYKHLAQYGEGKTIFHKIKMQVYAPPFIYYQVTINEPSSQQGELCLTEDWIVILADVWFHAIQIADAVWIYSKEYYGKGFGHTFYVNDHRGKRVSFNIAFNQNEVTVEVTDYLREKGPWIMIGYTPELNEKWNKDRAGFIAMVEQRRTAFTAAIKPTD